jgi:hypothetical protein
MLLIKILGILICIALIALVPFVIGCLLSAIFDCDFLDIIENVLTIIENILIIIAEICALGIIIILAIILFIECLSLILL